MTILHIISGDLTGGAARGAYWLHNALIEIGVDSKIWTNSNVTFNDKNIYSIKRSKKDCFFEFVRKQIDGKLQIFYPNRKKVIFSTGFAGVDFTKSNLFKDADVIHLHWINNGFVKIKHLSKIDKPIVWTMRDMWPMTGGCHIASALKCDNFKSGCGNCKQLNSNHKYDLSRLVLNNKRKYLPKHLKIIGISKWISEEANNSTLFRDFDVRTIHNSINTNDFYPLNKRLAREMLGIKTNKKVVLVGAQNLKIFHKGFDKFIEATRYLDKDKYFLCFFGNVDDELLHTLGFEYLNFGFLYDLPSLRLLYNAGDVFVTPSLIEAFGKTIGEAMACGTPVVCFDVTGPKDIVTHKKDGYLAKCFEVIDLANGIEWIVNNNRYEKLCVNAREKVVTEFDGKVIAKKYHELYKSIIK